MVANHPLLRAYIAYMNRLNEMYPNSRTTLIQTLRGYYTDEEVAKILETWSQHWLSKGEHPSDVFLRLELNKARDKLFQQPQLLIWVKYLDAFNQEFFTQKKTLVISLLEMYDEKGFVDMVIAARDVPSTKSVAARVIDELADFWLGANKQPADIFALRSLDQDPRTLFQSPWFIKWLQYVDNFNVGKAERVSALWILELKYRRQDLMIMLQHVGMSSITKSLATDLEAEMLLFFQVTNPTKEEVKEFLTNLRLTGPDDSNICTNAWYRYFILK